MSLIKTIDNYIHTGVPISKNFVFNIDEGFLFGSGWKYKKLLHIEGSAGAGNNYQVLLKVGEVSTASNYDFHLDNKSSNFPSGTNDSGDLRFTKSNDTTLLNFWVEKVEGTAPNRTAYCWVKIEDNLDNDVDIYCYYGNDRADNVSSVSDTFIREISGIVGAWNFDEGSGNTVYDTSGNNNNGTLINGPTWVNGKYGKALSFDGYNDYIQTSLDPSNPPLTDITMIAWVKIAEQTNYRGLMGAHVDGYKGIAGFQYNNSWAVSYGDGSSWPGVGIDDLDLNTWLHLAGVIHSGSNGYIKIFVNSVNRQTVSVSTTISPYNQFWIGRTYNASDRYFHGTIDHVQVYSVPLSSVEISDLYNNYGYTTTSYPGKVLVRKYVSPEPHFTN